MTNILDKSRPRSIILSLRKPTFFKHFWYVTFRSVRKVVILIVKGIFHIRRIRMTSIRVEAKDFFSILMNFSFMKFVHVYQNVK